MCRFAFEDAVGDGAVLRMLQRQIRELRLDRRRVDALVVEELLHLLRHSRVFRQVATVDVSWVGVKGWWE